MRTTTALTVVLVLAFVASVVPFARAEVATPQEMERVCRNQLSYFVYEGGWSGY
ncbi:MAG: hypothetical protein JSU63_19545 [Phycisphaerales bacterium]|nr:MAG: hypothetical protein JSU63_19545 [Phycisphaerales bacterium]